MKNKINYKSQFSINPMSKNKIEKKNLIKKRQKIILIKKTNWIMLWKEVNSEFTSFLVFFYKSISSRFTACQIKCFFNVKTLKCKCLAIVYMTTKYF